MTPTVERRRVTPAFATLELHQMASLASPLGIFLLDLSGDVLFVNLRLCAILGVPAEEIVGRGFLAHLHPDDRENAAQTVATTIGTGDSSARDYRLLRADGCDAWIRVWFAPSRGEGDGVRCIAGVVDDVTEQRVDEERSRALAAKLQNTRKIESLGLLAGGIAHDFNNLLVGIMGNAALLQMDIEPDTDAGATLSDLCLAADRATEMTAQLLAFSGRGTLASTPVNLTAAVEETHTLLASTTLARARVTLDLAGALPHVAGDPTRLRQVVRNLLSNAADALGEEGGDIMLRTGIQIVDVGRRGALTVDGGLGTGPHVFLEVRDTGCGMSAATLSRMFEPFFTTKKKGRGLGLAATIGTILAHKAGVEVVSEVGAGTTVRLLLPIDPTQPGVSAVEKSGTARAGGSGVIMVVDDDSAVRDVTRRLLTRQGFEVLEAADGAQAIAVLSESPARIKCVLLDMTMPGMDGSETFKRMREVVPTLRVVLTSGHTEESIQARFAGLGIAGFLQKPFDLSSLLRATKAAIES